MAKKTAQLTLDSGELLLVQNGLHALLEDDQRSENSGMGSRKEVRDLIEKVQQAIASRA